MARFCTNCGNEIPDGVAFCTECGTAAPAEAPVYQSVPQAPPPPATTAAPVTTAAVMTAAPPVYAQAYNEQAPKGKYDVVGTGTYFGLMFVFAIPVLGWLVCIIMAFASKNENKKHFARAMLIWLVIGIALSVAVYFVFRWLGGSLTSYINELTGGQFGDIQELLEQFKQFENVGSMLPTN